MSSTNINLNGIDELDVTVTGGSASASTSGGKTSLTLTGAPTILLQTNSVNNGSQTKLNLKQGTNVSIADDGVGGITINASSSPIAADLNTVIYPPSQLTVNNNFQNFSTFLRFRPNNVATTNGKLKIVLAFTGGTTAVLGGAQIFRLNQFSGNASAMTSIGTFLWSGSATPTFTVTGSTLTSPTLFPSDSLTVTLDNTHDYAIIVYYSNVVSNSAIGLLTTAYVDGGFLSGNHLSDVAYPSTLGATATSVYGIIKVTTG